MGKNTYLGGSTVLNSGSSFFSKDRNSKRSRIINAEKDFIFRCVRAELAGRKCPNSYAEHEKLRTAITKNGNVESWVKAHPDYLRIKEREVKKHEKRVAEKVKKKVIGANLKKKQSQNKDKKEKIELKYLRNYIWSQIVEREPPKNKPKGFDAKYPTNEDSKKWAISHGQFTKTYQELSQKREKQLEKMDSNKNHSVEIIYKNKKRNNT